MELALRAVVVAFLAACAAHFVLISPRLALVALAPALARLVLAQLTQLATLLRKLILIRAHGAVVALVTLAGVISEFASGALVANWRRVFRDVLAPGTIEAPRVRSGFWCVGSV